MEGINSLKKILFVVTEMRLGGRERVVGEVADMLGRSESSGIFSVWKRKPFFKTATDVVFSVDENADGISDNSKINHHNKKIIGILKNKFIFPIVKVVAQYSFLQRKRINELVKYINKNNINNVILTDLTMTFSSKLKKQCPNINLVGWIHMQPDAFFETQYKGFKKELIYNMNFLDEAISLTQEQALAYKDYLKNDKIVSIPNPMPKVASETSCLMKKNIVVVCRIDIFHKGLDYLVLLAKLLPNDWGINIAGSGSLEDENRFTELVRTNGVMDKIHWVRALKGDELDDFYNDGSLFLMTSRFEGFPMTLGEAMSHGLPIVSFEVNGTKTILDNGKYGILVELGNIQELSKQVLNLINSYDLRLEYSKLSLKRIDDFSENIIVKEWNKLLV